MDSLLQDIVDVRAAYDKELAEVNTVVELEEMRLVFLSRNGKLAVITKQFQELTVDDKRTIGPRLQELKKYVHDTYEAKKTVLEKFKLQQEQLQNTLFDVTAYREPLNQGSLHVYTQTIQELENIFISMGYRLVSGPEVETEQNNFDALNIPAQHPARDMQDTFWLPQAGMLLRTHTSPVQIRALTAQGPSVAVFSTGRVYRNEETDASHDYLFTQGEALLVGESVSMANLIATVRSFLQAYFNNDTLKVRVRPGYFPFVEPGIEFDCSCPFCTDGCSTCKRTGWIELMGGGLVHRNVLINCGVNPDTYSGFAFGFGIERLIMIKYGVDDIRLLHSSQLSFLKQF